MPYFFASDVHLRNDRPDRDRRFSAWLGQLSREDSLVIAGDLCDFWMGARKARERPLESASIRAILDFRRAGGSLSIMAGNHDEWLCPFYESELGATIIHEPYDTTVFGHRLRIVHGHRLGAKPAWKSLLEGEAFFKTFGAIPYPLARTLDRILTWRNLRGLDADEERHMRFYRDYAARLERSVDLVIIGHVHRPADLALTHPRVVVLGGWQHGSSFLKIDESGAHLHVDRERPSTSQPNAQKNF